MPGKVYVVTGGNKGLGFAVCKQLCEMKQPDDTVYLTARNVSFGMYAQARLKEAGLEAEFFNLDILEKLYLEDFSKMIKEKHGGIDVLVNNAAVAGAAKLADIPVMNNYHGTLDCCEYLFPLLNKNARVVNVGCRAGPRTFVALSEEHKRAFADPNLTKQGLTELMTKYVASFKKGNHKKEGYTDNTGYGMSKLGVMRLTSIQQAEMDKDKPDMNIVISTCCPGYICTDLSLLKGSVKPQDGAKVVIKLATLPEDFSGVKGGFWEGEEPLEWLPEQQWNEKWTRGESKYC